MPPGIADAVTPNPVFSFTPSATVDEGNNWINVSWGPLALSNPAVQGTDLNWGGGPALANYNLTAAIDTIPATVAHPPTDFYGNARPENADPTAHFDPGAIEFGSSLPVEILSVTGGPLTFRTPTLGTATAAQTLTLHNTGAGAGTINSITFSSSAFSRPTAGGTCPTTTPFTLAAFSTCTYNVVFTATTTTSVTGTLTFSGSAPVAGSPVSLTGNVVGQLSFTSATNGTLVGTILRTLTFTIPTPRAPVTSVVTITNTGAGSLQITAETLALNFGGLYSLTPATTCSFTTPLAAGGTCTVSVRYATPTTRPILPDSGLLTVANNGFGTVGGVSLLMLIAQ